MSSHSLALTSAPQNRTSGNIDISSYDDDYSQNQSHYGIPAPLHYRQVSLGKLCSCYTLNENILILIFYFFTLRRLQEGGGMHSPWRLFEERVRTGPFGLTRY